MTNTKTIFELKNASYNYNETVALCNISMKINAGEKICILGANGCGKSTLLKIFAGLLYVQNGEFVAFGDRIERKNFDSDSFAAKYHRKVGFIFQNSDVQLFCTTVREEIAFGPLQIGIGNNEVQKRVDEIADMLDIGTLLDKTPFNLSGGEKKKVAVAAVLALNPGVLILDEPTNELDPRSQRWLVNLLIELNRAGKTLIISTHNLELVSEISDRSLLFSEGHTLAADRPTADMLHDTALLKSVNLVDEDYCG